MSKSSILCYIQSVVFTLLKYHQFSQTQSSSLYIVKASVFSIYSIESPDICLDRDLGLLGPISSPPICCLACIQPYFQLVTAFIPCSRYFPSQNQFLTRLPHTIVVPSLQALVSLSTDFQEFCLLLSSSKFSALHFCPLYFSSFTP